MAEILLHIAEDACIRGMRVDGVDLFSVLDFIKTVSPERSSVYATQIWKRLTSRDSHGAGGGGFVHESLLPEWKMLKFNGKGQRDTPCMAIPGLQMVLFVLSIKVSLQLRAHVLECFRRVFAGDRTLIREVAAQNLPVQPIARATMAMQDDKNYAKVDGAPVQGLLQQEELLLEITDQEVSVVTGAAADQVVDTLVPGRQLCSAN